MSSPDGTRIGPPVPSPSIVDAAGVVWTISHASGNPILQNGVAKTGHATQLLWHAGSIYAKSPTGGIWWKWLGTMWLMLNGQDPNPPPADVTSPDTMIVSGPSNSVSTTATITFSGTDDVAVTSFEGSLDGAAYAPVTSPVNLSGLSAGAHTYAIRAKDAAGNVDQTPAIASWTVSALVPGSFKSVTMISQDQSTGAAQLYPKTGAQRVDFVLNGSGTYALLAPNPTSTGNGFGNRYRAVCDPTMGHEDNMPFRFNVQDGTADFTDHIQTLQVQPVNVIFRDPPNTDAFEDYYLGYQYLNDPALHLWEEAKLDALLDWITANFPGASTTKRTIKGGSMGAWGCATYAFRRPDKFAAVFASRPRLRFAYAEDANKNPIPGHVDVPTYASPFATNNPAMPVGGSSETSGQHLDLVAYATNPANPMPFIAICAGRHDGFLLFQDFIDFIAACRATGRGIVAAWNDLDHGGGDIMASAINTSYNRPAFEIGVGYPVLSGCSLDQDPAVDLAGGINLGFVYVPPTVETPTNCVFPIKNINGSGTVSVAPHSDIYTGDKTPKLINFTQNVSQTVSFP